MSELPAARTVTPWPPELIDLDHLIGLGEAANLVRRWSGTSTNPSTLFRWCRTGRYGVLLPHVRMGRHIRTTETALRWWVERTTSAQIIAVPEDASRRPLMPADELTRELEAEGL